MESSLRRKRKGARSSSASASASAVGSCRSDGGDGRSKKKCRDSSFGSPRHEKSGSCAARRAVMTAPPSGRSTSESPGRGLKRKLGCVLPETQIGRKKKLEHVYTLGKPLGQGKFGSVRVCQSKLDGKKFACKTLPKNGEESVHKEVEIMQHLSGHPNVVTLMAVFEDLECCHLVMELCAGGRLLDEMVREGRYSEHRAANLIKQVVMVLKYCHEMGVVHRDVKPENILLTASGKVKLADFGLAVRVASGQRLSGIAGSPAYVAPEVLSGPYSEKVDIWGAGVLLHALLVGVLPFKGDSRDAVFEAIKTVELDFHSGMWESISKLARDLLSRMLCRDVSSRMTADEILRHPWILFYTESPSRALPVKPRVRSSSVIRRIELGGIGATNGFTSSLGSKLRKLELGGTGVTNDSSSSVGSSDRKSEEQQERDLVADLVSAAISRVTISEPKRSRLCSPALPSVQQECSSNMKANLCTAF